MLGKLFQAPPRVRGYLLLLLLGFLLQGQKPMPTASKADGGDDLGEKVVRITVKGTDVTDDVRLRSLRELIKQADREGAAALVLSLHTPAGYSPDLAGLLLGDLAKLETPIYAHVDPAALGMGALLAMVADEVYLTPSAVVGGAAPNTGTGKESESSGQTLSVLKAQVRSLAAAKGRSAKLVEAMIDAEAASELRRLASGAEEEEKDKPGEVLTITAQEAVASYLGEKALAQGLAESSEEMIGQISLKGEIVDWTPNDWARARERTASKTGADAPAKDAGKTGDGIRGRESYAGKILILEVGNDDLLSKARFEFMERVLDRAREERAAALILDMNTPGGAAWQTSELILRAVSESSVPTYTFVNPHAQSAGSLIAVATDHIYMFPTSTIGAALVVTGTGQDLPEAMNQKIESMFRSEIRNVAIAKGHNPDVAEAFVTTETEVVMDGVVISEKGKVLTLNALEATREYEGKPLLAMGLAESIDEILEKEGLEGEKLMVKPQGLEAFAEWVQLASVLLIAVGLAGAYMELNSPGFGIPGIISVLAFSLFFFGNHMAGNLVGYGTAVVFVLGFILLIVELFVIPGTFVAGALGAVLMLGALGSALVDRVDFAELQRGGESAPTFAAVFQTPALTLSLAIMVSIALIALLMRYLPSMGPFRGLVLEGEVASGTSITGSVAGSEELLPGEEHALLGVAGDALTDLRPAGKARIGGVLYDVTTESEFVSRGEGVRVVDVKGDRVIVEAVGSA